MAGSRRASLVRMNVIGQTTPVRRAAHFNVIAEARVVCAAKTTGFGKISLYGARDPRAVGMVLRVYAMP